MMVTKVDIHILNATSMIKIEKKGEAHRKLNMMEKMKEVSDQTNIKIENYIRNLKERWRKNENRN